MVERAKDLLSSSICHDGFVDPGDDRIVVANAIALAREDFAIHLVPSSVRNKKPVTVERCRFVRGLVADPTQRLL